MCNMAANGPINAVLMLQTAGSKDYRETFELQLIA